MRTIGLLALGLAAVAGPIALTPGVASAAETASAKACVVNAETGASACAATEAEAYDQVYGSSRAATYPLVKLWDGTGYTGAVATIYGGRGCTTSYDTEFYFRNLAFVNMNNRAGSVNTYNNCDVRLFDNTGMRGSRTTWINYAGNLGAFGWSNRASSLRIS